MAKVMESHSEMAHARHNDGINVIFDQKSPASSLSRSRSRSSGKSSRSSVSSHYRGRGSHKRRYRSPSSSPSSSCNRSSSQRRSRSHPRCHRRSSRCRCDSHHRSGYRRYRRSSPRRCRDRSRSRSFSRQSRHRRAVRRCRLSRSPSRTNRSCSNSRSSRASLEDKRQLHRTAEANAMTILRMEKLELRKRVKPILPEQPESKWESLEPETRVRQAPEKTSSQSHEMESDDMPSLRISQKKKIISFSLNNSVAKPTVAAPSSAKVTARVDIYESRKPYGHWVPVRSGQTSNSRKHPFATFR